MKATGEQISYQFLIQRVYIAILTSNAISVLGTLDQLSRTSEDSLILQLMIYLKLILCHYGHYIVAIQPG